MQESRANLPEIKEATYSDCFLISYILMSLLPMTYLAGTWDSYSGYYAKMIDMICQYISYVIVVLSTIALIIKYIIH